MGCVWGGGGLRELRKVHVLVLAVLIHNVNDQVLGLTIIPY